MSKKWIEREGPGWVKAGIVSDEQVKQLSALYDDRRHALSLLPLLGGLLLGLGILLFIAANWSGIPAFLRLVLLAFIMVQAYISGQALLSRGHEKTGVGFITVGWISFGGGMLLISQMFHLLVYSAWMFIIWAAVGACLTWLVQSRFLFIVTLVSCHIAQFVSVSSFYQYQLLIWVLWAVMGWFAWRLKESWPMWLVSASAALQPVLWLSLQEAPFLWAFVPWLALYALFDYTRHSHLRLAGQGAVLTAAFLVALWFALIGAHSLEVPSKVWFLLGLSAAAVVSAVGKYKRNDLAGFADVLLFVPFFYMNWLELMYTLVLFVFSLLLLWRGYAEQRKGAIHAATVLFLMTTLIAYSKLTWGFMDKSLFFIVGGALLLGLGWFLNRKRTQFIQEEAKGGADKQ